MSPTFNIGDAKTRLSHPVTQAGEGRDVIIIRTIELLRRERKEHPSVSAVEICAARDEGRA